MGHCKDCRHWNKDSFSCETVEWMDDYADSNTSPGEYDFKLAVVYDDDQGLSVGLKTGPMFGCVQYQHNTSAKETI